MKKVINDITVLDYAAEGKCIAKVDDKVLFVKHSAPGDRADILVTRKRKGFMEGRPVKFHEYSKKRIDPFCKHFNYCGGCQWQHVSYSEQLEFKEKQVFDQLKRIGGVELPKIEPILGCEEQTQYRNKLEFSFSSAKWLMPEELQNPGILKSNGLGFHISGHFDKVLDITNCHLQENLSNDIRNWLRQYAIDNEIDFFRLRERKGTLRSLVIRNTRAGSWMIIMQFGAALNEKTEALLNNLIEKFPQITSLYYVINEKLNDTFFDLETVHFHGEEYLFERIGDLNFRIRPKSFFQTNPNQAEKLYKYVADFCGETENKIIYDLYAGTGTIALYLGQKAKKVVGVESVDQAIEDAKWNAENNKISNVDFECGDMRHVLNDDFLKEHGQPDIIVTDPPRDGMHKDVVETLLRILPKRIVYVSCKPSTQARDLSILKEKYDIGRVKPVDMFPHTHHVENIVQLNLK